MRSRDTCERSCKYTSTALAAAGSGLRQIPNVGRRPEQRVVTHVKFVRGVLALVLCRERHAQMPIARPAQGFKLASGSSVHFLTPVPEGHRLSNLPDRRGQAILQKALEPIGYG
jgi:hypothetical protein